MKSTTQKIIRQISFMAVDVVFILLAWFLSIWLYSYLFSNEAPLVAMIWQGVFWLIIINIVVFMAFGIYKSIWKYSSIGALLKVGVAVFIICFADYVYFRLASGYWQSPAIPVMAFFIALTLCGGVRILPRLVQYVLSFYNERKNKTAIKRVNTLIIGAGQAASSLLLDIKRQKPISKYNVIALVDDDITKHRMTLHGIKVIGGCDVISEVVKQRGVEKIIIAMPSATRKQLQRILMLCPTEYCKVSIIPGFDAANANSVRDIDFADLLGRDETVLDISGISEMVKNKTVMVTGGGGSIGSELVRQLLKFDVKTIVIYDMYENSTYDLLQEVRILYGCDIAKKLVIRIGSVQDEERLEQVFAGFKPAIVFHAAAYKHVPLMEECPRLAVKNNVFGTRITAELSKKYDVEKFVMISTDKAVNPTNIMGATKRLAEKVVMALNEHGKTEFVCVRFGNVLGSNGSVIPIFEKQIKHGGPLTVTDPEITRYFMTIPEAAKLVIQAAAMAVSGTIFVLDMGKPVKIAELAENIIRLSGYVPNEEIKIEYVGLRPGEKLYEELLTDEEGITKTKNEKIFVAKPTVLNMEQADKLLEDFRDNISNDGELRACIKQYVPEYKEPVGSVMGMSFLDRFESKQHIEKKIFADIKKNPHKAVALFGAGGAGFYLNKWLMENDIYPVCFIDDDIKKQQHGYIEMPVLSYQDFCATYKEHIIFVSIANHAVRAMEGLLSRGEAQDVYYVGSRDPWSKVTDYAYICEHSNEYESAYNLYADEFSKKVFVSILNNKLTGDVHYASDVKTENMYFDEEIVTLDKDEVFLDVGACDGENAVQFAQLLKGQYERLLAFEPDEINIKHMKERFSKNGIENYTILPICAWNKREILDFSAGLEHTSNVNQDGHGVKVQADTIDNILDGKRVTFIKMDIEGAEKNALLGASKTIAQYKPKLAISIYHKREDYFELPLLIQKLNPSYRFYLRNYTDAAADTVLYAI
ncbi:MAG: FkbM family methyltransferase [Christensenellaceae bacterium]